MAESLFSKKLSKQPVFINVNQTKDGKPFLKITSGKKVNDEWQNESVAIWQENISEFFQALREAAPHLK